jgi:hypothetical protein
MRGRSEDEQTLIRIQREWAEARVKDDSSYARRVEANDCTIVWPDGSIVNKQQDLQTMTGDIVFSEGTIKAHKGKQDLLNRKFVWTDTFAKQGGQWKVVASQITPVLEK